MFSLDLPEDLFGFWLMNNDQMWDNFIPTTTKDPNFVDNHGQVVPMELTTPVPTFSGRLAVNCKNKCMTKVCTTTNYFNSSDLIPVLEASKFCI